MASQHPNGDGLQIVNSNTTTGSTFGVHIGTSTTLTSYLCTNCNTWHGAFENCPSYTPNYWYYPTPVIRNDAVAELKAWIDGFMTNRKMTPGNIKRIQKRLDEFCGTETI